MNKWWLVLVVFLAGGGMANAATLHGGSAPGVIVFETKDKMTYFMTECRGNRMAEDDCLFCLIALADNGTKVSVIDSTFTARQVRIMSGPHRDKVGWVPMEMVK